MHDIPFFNDVISHLSDTFILFFQSIYNLTLLLSILINCQYLLLEYGQVLFYRWLTFLDKQCDLLLERLLFGS
jgi:hypothetical protein